MALFIDLIIISIIVVSAVLATLRGLIGTVFNLLGTFIAVVLSIALCSPVAGFIDSGFVKPAIKDYITDSFESSADELSEKQLYDAIDKLPKTVRFVLDYAGVDVDELVDDTNSGISVEKTADKIASPISITISRVIAMILMFVVISIVLWVATRLLTLIFSFFPLGKKINRIGGAIFGVARGLLISFVVATLFSAISMSTPSESRHMFSEKTINETLVLKTAIKINPIASALNIK